MDRETCLDITPRRMLDFDDTNKDKELLGNDNVEGQITDESLTISADRIPKIDMEFDSEKAAFAFYNEYAKQLGFSTRRTTVHTDSNGRILDRVFCCECQGYRPKDKRDANCKSHRPETRTGCGAMMKINARKSGKYKVDRFIPEHNHALVSPRKAHMLKSHRKITEVQAAQADDLDSSGITPRAGFDLMSRQVGGRENVGFVLEDYKNYLHSKRTREMKTGDTAGVLEYLQQRQLDDSNFFYGLQVDEDQLIANILWIDAQMKADYSCFGDVVSFDTTYRKNKDGRPFCLFVGVNHHKQTVVFGAALLYDETTSTFIWLFDTFASAMSGKLPQTILTDQDAAMSKALATQWPDTYHRLCIWHIYQNAATHLSNVFARFPSFLKEFSYCVYNYEEEEEFLNGWNRMLETYGLQTNEWLGRLFKIREKWALVYGRHTFCAEMMSTQRSESMHSALKKYVSYKHNLVQFFHHFDRLIEDRRYQELKADFRTSHSTPVTSFPAQICKHASNIYTHEIFLLFKDELHKAYDAKIEFCGETEEISEYQITLFGKHHPHKVMYHSSQGKVSCSCKKFEFAGILCSHVLKVFSLKNIMEIPDLYIKKRWTKQAKKDFVSQSPRLGGAESSETIDENDEKKMMRIQYKELGRLCNQVTTRASRAAATTKTFEVAKLGLLRLIEEIDTSLEDKIVSPTVRPKSVAPSRLATKQTSTSEVCDMILDESGQAHGGGIVVKGWKEKDKPIKSGKRPRSALEKTQRRKKQNKATVQIENNNEIQNIGNRVGDSSIGASLPFSQLPSLSQFSQEYQVGGSNLSMSFSTEGHRSRNYQQNEMSLTQLLQEQHNFGIQ